MVIGSMREFSKPQYHVDVLKVEVPTNAEFVEASSVYKGQAAYTRQQALEYYRQASETAKKPFIYLSAGVGNAQFVESLNMAAEAGTDYSGVIVRPRHLERGHTGLREKWSEGVRGLDERSGRKEHQRRERRDQVCETVVREARSGGASSYA